jgi:hypothetical protein
MWSKSQESTIKPAVDRPVDDAPTRDGLRRRAGHGVVPGFIKILDAGSRGAEAALSIKALASATAALTSERSQIVGEGRAGREPAGDIGCDEGRRRHTQGSVGRVIDLRTDIVVIRADVTRTHGWSASRDGGTGSCNR